MTRDHDHSHHQHHSHDHADEAPPSSSDPAVRVRALESALTERGLIDPAALDAFVDYFENRVGPRNGAQVVARAWADSGFKERLLADGTAAVAEFAFPRFAGEYVTVVENTDEVHNVVVCTLCSCYPWPLLGMPPEWYKSFSYRARIVREPREVLRELGLEVPDTVELRVWDSTADLRFMVLPQRPPGSEGLGEAELAALVSRDSMIGTALVAPPGDKA
jgi:nitrile hydratase subunit alpha